MKLTDYLGITLGKRYDLDDKQIQLAAAVLVAIRDKGVRPTMVCAPRLNIFLEVEQPIDMFDVLTVNRSWFYMVRAIDMASSEADFGAMLNEYITSMHGDLSRVALAVSSELVIVRELKEFLETPAEDNSAPAQGDVVAMEGATWLKDGILVIDEHTWDLNEKIENDAPVEVQIARLIYSTRDPSTGVIGAKMLEQCAVLLARFMTAERSTAINTVKSLEEQVAKLQERSKLGMWPADKEHWVYDPAMSAPCAPVIVAPGEARDLLTSILSRAARFAVSRASGMGTSRALNIEGFVDNVVIGVIGQGNEENATDGEALKKAFLAIPRRPRK